MAVKRLLLLALIVTSTVQAADAPFGDIPASLSISSGQSVRRNAGNTAFEAYTPGSGGGGTPGGSNTQVQYNNSSSFGGITGATSNGTIMTLTSPSITTPTGLVSNDVGLGSVTNDAQTKAVIVPNTAPSSGQILVGNAGGTAYAKQSVSGDATLSSAGVVTTTKNVTFTTNGLGIVLSSGTKLPIKIHPGGTLAKWTAMCSPSGSVSWDLLRSANAGGLPVTSMVGVGTKPTISSGVENHGTITDWDFTVLSDNDNLNITLSGISTCTWAEITFYWQ